MKVKVRKHKKSPAPLVAEQDEVLTLNKLRKRILRFGVLNSVKIDDTCNFLGFNDASYLNLKEIQARIREVKQSIRHHLH